MAFGDVLHVFQTGFVVEDFLEIASGDIAFAETKTLWGHSLGFAAFGVVVGVTGTVSPSGQLTDAFDAETSS